MVRPVPAGRRGSCCTPYSRLQEEIDNVETIAVTANNTANNASQLAQQAMSRDTFDDVNVNGDLNIYGDIIQQGAAYETHAEHIFSTDDYIVMRDGALVGLAQGDYSGFQVKKYDGTNDGRLVIDRDGVARVGDVGDEQALLTRDESADMVNAAPLVWDAANSKAISGAFPVPDPGVATINSVSPDASNNFEIEAGTGVTITQGVNKITIAAAGGGSGAWTKRTANNDWSDLFTVSGTTITANKTMVIYDADTGGEKFIPKGSTFVSRVEIPLSPNISNVSGSPEKKRIRKNVILKYNYVTSGNLYRSYTVITFANDGTSTLETADEAYAKANTVIYTLDE